LVACKIALAIASGEPLPQKCPSCGAHTSASAPFCAHCGKPLISDSDVTSTRADTPTLDYSPTPNSSRPSSRPSSRSGRFVPGDMIAGRYRIISMLGRGGMGEVYRADDLNLGQDVALKFLPESATDEAMLERFRNEVRIARQISHPNVCRVYDIGEANQQIYLSMEYIDGEDLASLLRRIGRLPSDKAVEIARKVCAGISAAHNKGVLHRDLKPANIMLDGRGEALVTDFGLAGLAAEITDVHSGTPAYMAPEQLSGKEVTKKSDIYSLGLVLYELFTGKRAFDGRTLEEITQVRRNGHISRPSMLVKDIDPAVERAIFRCLEEDPNARPSSALEIAASLPGGDPLAAALAAGETPSPQLVAAAGDRTGVPVKLAVSLFSGVLVALIAMCLLGPHGNLLNRMDLPYSPEVLSQKTRDVTVALGYKDPGIDSAEYVDIDGDLYRYLQNPTHTAVNWNNIATGTPPLLYFWRRQSPGTLVALQPKDNSLVPGIVSLEDPPPITSGTRITVVDTNGKLLHFESIPPQQDKSPPASATYDWRIPFQLAGLDFAGFKSAEPTWNTLAEADTRAAWTGTWPGTMIPLRVEAGSYRGQLSYFTLLGDWTKPNREASSDPSGRASETGAAVSFAMLIAVAVLIARRNLRRGKGDREGTLTLAKVVFALNMALFFCKAHFVASIGSFGLLVLAIAGALCITAFACVLYLAIEPFVRRHWPHAIISWTRLLSGRLRDPLVGRDVMIGAGLGISWGIAYNILFLKGSAYGFPPNVNWGDFILGPRAVLGGWIWHLANSVQATLGMFFLMFVFRVLLRKPWLAAIAFVALWSALKVVGSQHPMVLLPLQVFVYAGAAFVLIRFGALALATGIFVADILLNIAITSHLTAWYYGGTWFVLVTVLALLGWAFYIALAGQKLWKESLFD
jgi:tRNA A-37 threonylcarbamoyl transferase component Bud32